MRKVRTGSVVRTRMDKTAVVEFVWKQRHRLYRKQMRRVARFHVHDPLNQCRLGDVVRIQEVRPVSKTKRWRLLEILERHQVAEVRPIDLEADAEIAAPEVQEVEPEQEPEPEGEPEPEPEDEPEPEPEDEEPEE
jgi:small subunit ribosomal protein S17